MSGRSGWHAARLDELCDINPPKPRLHDVDDSTEALFVPMAAVNEVSGTVSNPLQSSVGVVGRKSYRSFTSGDVLFAKITPCMENGKAAVVPSIPTGLGFGSTEFHVLRPKPGTDARLIWHLIRQQSFRDEAAGHFTGTVGQLRVPADHLASFEVMVPTDMRDQAKLADHLDASINHSLSASSHLATARRAIQRFRQAVFAAACSGRLTAGWRDTNDFGETANDLVASIDETRKLRLGRRYKAPTPPALNTELPDGWTWTTVGALVDVATGATPLRKRADYYNGSIPWVTSAAVNAGRITHATEHITELAIDETNAKIFPAGTLLVAMYGEGQTRGRVAQLEIPAATNQAVAALLFDDDTEHLRDYLRVFFLENYERIRQLSFGGVQPNLSLGAIRETPLPLPPAEEQAEIVRRVERLLQLASDRAH